MEEKTKRKWLGVLLSFIWVAVLTPVGLLIFSVPTSEWIVYWLFYPFFVALLVMLDIFVIPAMFKIAWGPSGDDALKAITIAIACAIIAIHSGLYFIVSGGLAEIGVYMTFYCIFVGTFLFIIVAIFFIMFLVWLIKLFIRLNKRVFFGKK